MAPTHAGQGAAGLQQGDRLVQQVTRDPSLAFSRSLASSSRLAGFLVSSSPAAGKASPSRSGSPSSRPGRATPLQTIATQQPQHHRSLAPLPHPATAPERRCGMRRSIPCNGIDSRAGVITTRPRRRSRSCSAL